MKFLKKLFSGKTIGAEKQGSVEVQAILSPLPDSAREFMKRIHSLRNLHLSTSEYNQHLRYFVTSMPQWLTREIHQMIRDEIYRVDIAPPMDAETTKSGSAQNSTLQQGLSHITATTFIQNFHGTFLSGTGIAEKPRPT